MELHKRGLDDKDGTREIKMELHKRGLDDQDGA
jgi:hypothetical protein